MLTEKQVNALFERANNFIRMGNLKAAVQDYTQVIEHRPDFAPAYYNHAFARQHGAQDIEGAIEDYTTALRLRPDFAEAYANRAIAYKQLGDVEACIADYSRAIQLLPPAVHTVYNNRGEVYFLSGNYAAALADFQQALEHRPGYRFALAGMAVACYQLGNYEKAESCWRLLLSYNEQFNDLDWLREELGWDAPLLETAARLVESRRNA